jgi:hypothetical protein
MNMTLNRNTLIAALVFFAVLIGIALYLSLSRKDTFIPEDLAPTATGSSVIDLMVIYNEAAETLYNNDVETRINHLVDVSNQIYKDSGAGVSLRLVHTQKVNYEAGYDSETAVQHITDQSHPAFDEVPALREQHGADLVVLMRPNSDDGYCGLAWIGGNGTNGDFSHPDEKNYGFSHVSIDCGTYVLAHELGHNMGLNHSRKQDATGGTFDFALGYGIDNDFTTVMAYSSAFNASKTPVFSNPSLNCGSSACGVDRETSDGADAVYTLNIVAPQIANYFVATSNATLGMIHSSLDMDGNGTSDLILHHASGSWNLGAMNGAEVTALQDLPLTPDPDWLAAGRGDYDADGMADILTRNRNTGAWRMFLMRGNEIKSEGDLTLTANLDWQVAGNGDFDGDGKGDVLLRHLDGRWYQYFLDGTSVGGTARPDLPKELNVHLASTGDFNGDGKTDVLTRADDGAWHLYQLNGGDVKAESSLAMKKSLDWQVVGSGDFDGNERDDLLMRYKNGSWLVYHFDDFSVDTPTFLELTEDLDWKLATIGDFDADGDTDVLLRSAAFGTWRLYKLNQNQIQSTEDVALTPDLNWTVPQS